MRIIKPGTEVETINNTKCVINQVVIEGPNLGVMYHLSIWDGVHRSTAYVYPWELLENINHPTIKLDFCED